MRTRIVAALAALLVAAGSAGTAAPAVAPAGSVKTCSSGWKHAVIGGAHKCLRSGQFCAQRYDSQYKRYGYRCTKYDAKVSRYRLTRA